MADPPARRARSYGSVAARYAQHRPGYPDQAVACSLHSSPINGQILGVVAGPASSLTRCCRAELPQRQCWSWNPTTRCARRCPGRTKARLRSGIAERSPPGTGW